MKILWIVNTIFPYPSKQLGYKTNVFGGWLLGLYESMIKNKNIKLAIATTYTGNKFLKFEDNSTTYYLLPCKNMTKYNKNIEKYWKQIESEFAPDLAHLHGTEYTHGLSFQKACPDVKTVVSIQGMTSVYADSYLANIKHSEILKNITFRDFIKHANIFQEQNSFIKRGIYEREIIKNGDAIIGRTEWDYANTIAITKDDKYYKCNETLRNSFYKNHWDIKKIEKHSIFISQAGYPIKGLHIMLEAANILKEKYNNLKIYVAGNNIIDSSSFKEKMRRTGYAKYLKKLIKKYKLENIICFTGLLSEEEMSEKMKKTHVFVQTSSIENSPNSLGEAMILGMPCIASNVGGTSTMLQDKEEGFLYPFGDYGLLAYYICKIFDDDKLATELGEKAKQHANITHNKQSNENCMIEIYKQVINK